MRILTVSLLVATLSLPAHAAVHPTAERVERARSEDAVRIAKRRRKKRGKPVKVEPVRIRSAGTEQLALRQRGRKTHQVFTVTPETPLSMEVTGPGKLALVMHQLLPRGTKSRRVTFQVAVDGKRRAKVKVTNRPFRKGTLEGDVPQVSNGKKRLERLKGGTHAVDITAPAGSAGAVVRIEMWVTGAKKPAPVVIDAERSELMAAALDALDQEEPPPEPPPPPAPAPDPEPEPLEVAATPVETPAEPAATAAPALSEGVRHALAGDYPAATVVDEDSGETISFFRIGAEQSFSFMVQGPGEVTVRLHRLVAPETAATAAGSEYKIVILENDVLLQQLDGTTEVLTRRTLQSSTALAALTPPALSDAKEYRLKVGPKQSRFAFQIAQAPEGMVIRYEFAAEEMSLAAMALDFDDEEDDEGLGLGMAATAMPTVVMEVDVTEKTILVEGAKGFLGLGVYAGSMVPIAGGDMGMVGAFEISAALPWADRAFVLAVEGTFIRHQLAASIGDPSGAAIDAESTVYAVPMVGKLIGRLRLAEIFALYAHGGFGVSYVRAERAALGSRVANAQWLWTVRGGGGFELELGPGALVVDAGYLFAPTADFGTSLQGYTPTGPVFTGGYRLGL